MLPVGRKVPLKVKLAAEALLHHLGVDELCELVPLLLVEKLDLGGGDGVDERFDHVENGPPDQGSVLQDGHSQSLGVVVAEDVEKALGNVQRRRGQEVESIRVFFFI